MKTFAFFSLIIFVVGNSWSQDNCTYTCEIPSSFTPNNDGENDILMAQWDCQPEKFEAKVYSRWGQEIFSTKDPVLNYGGTDEKGNLMEPGTYFVSIEYKVDGEKVNKTHYFTILR